MNGSGFWRAVRGIALAVACGLAFGAQARAEVTISFWNNWDGDRAALLRAVLGAFERANPGIKVDNVTQPADATTQRMVAAVAAGTVPDLYMTSSTAITKWASLDALLPLDDLVKRDRLDLARLFYQSVLDASTFGGKLLQLPYKTTNSLLIWFNKDLFRQAGLDPEAPPRTWKELQDAALKLTRRNGDALTQLGLNVCINCSNGPEQPYIEWLSRNNGLLLTPDGKDVAFDRPEGVQALKWMVDFSRATAGSWTDAVRQFGVIYKDMRPAFYAGKVAMTMDGPFFYDIMKTEAPAMLDKVGVFLVPVNGDNPAARERYLSYGTPGYAIPRGAKHPEEAWKLLKFIGIADDGACAFFKALNRPDSPLKNCAAGLDLPAPIARTLVADVALMEGAVAPGALPQILARIEQMQESALLGKESPEAAIRSAARDVRQIIAEQ